MTEQSEIASLRRQLENLESLRHVLGNEVVDKARAQLEEQIRALGETAAGAAIGGDVTVKDGDFVAGNKWQIYLTQYADHPIDRVPVDALLDAYRRALAEECRRLPLGVVDPRFMQTSSPVSLHDIYVDLDVLAPVREERGKGETMLIGRLMRGEGGERMPLLDALAHPRVTRFVLLGDPGSGKTTFVDYMSYLLASGQPVGAPWEGLLPVRLVLRQAAARCIPAQAEKGEARMLWEALGDDVAARLGEDAARRLMPYLQRRLLQSGGLLLLDGLDEVPAADRRRHCLLEAVAALSAALPADRCRIVVTARPYAYADPAWRLEGFETLVLAPFNDEQRERFVRRWYQAVRPVMGWDEPTAREREERLLEALDERTYLADLAVRPLILTLMATLHTSWGRLPEDRAELYEETVKLLLSRWQRARQVKGADGRLVVEPGIATALAFEEEGRLRAVLEELAFRAHEGQRGAEDEEPAGIGEGDVLAAFAPLLPEDVNPQVLLKYLETRAGLLVGRAPGVYAFPHRSFQEYLAACYLADRPDFAQELRRRVWEDVDWWRQVFALGVGRARQGGLGNAVHVVNTLLPEGPEEVAERTPTHWQAALLAAEALLDLRFPAAAQGKPDFEAILKRTRRWLEALLETPDVLASRERAEAGDLLGRLGDRRPGVGVMVAAQHAAPLPDIVWCAVPAGPFLMGSGADDSEAWDDERPQHTLDLPAFWIARYPLTNAQYRPFVEGGGYDEPRYWTPDGWAWRTGEARARSLPAGGCP